MPTVVDTTAALGAAAAAIASAVAVSRDPMVPAGAVDLQRSIDASGVVIFGVTSLAFAASAIYGIAVDETPARP
jgi:hypothetical protein